MIRIKNRVTKRTKVHLTYEFDQDNIVHEKKMTIPTKLYDTLTEQEIFNRVRGQVMRERMKLDESKKALEELAGMAKAKEEGTSGSAHDEVLYSAEAHGIEDKEE